MTKKKQTTLKITKSNFRYHGYTLQDLRNNLINSHDVSTTLRSIKHILTEADLSNDTKIDFVYKIDLDLKNHMLKNEDVTIRKAVFNIFKIILANFEYQNQIEVEKTLSYIMQVKRFDKSIVLKRDADVLYKQFIDLKEDKSVIDIKKNKAKVDIEEFERQLRKFLIEKLKEKHGDEWWDKGIPNDLRENAYKRKINKLKEDPKCDFEVWEFLDFKGYIGIIKYGKNWHTIFKDVFHDKDKVTYPLEKLREFRNDLYHLRLNQEDLNKYRIFLEEISKYFSK
ncbi:hypothetical protein LCGC14_0888750 [marine sediment metagenome]|uniref:Swt1-like HEPN domain-containing protein n=1 Tax=marine sediment metagenome TaxID=412755 RepID=A0A0F9PKK7_9ZZZZ